jgi:hypothetical protein
MNRFLLAAATLALVAGTALTPAFAAAPPGPRASSENNWAGMTQTASSGYVADPATGARYPVYPPDGAELRRVSRAGPARSGRVVTPVSLRFRDGGAPTAPVA